MPKRSSKPQKDTQQMARSVLDAIAPDAEPAMKPAPNKAKPPKPKAKKDVEAIDIADSEGMAQPQGLPPKEKNPAAVALGRLGGIKGGRARAEALSSEKKKAIAKKAAAARWNRPRQDGKS